MRIEINDSGKLEFFKQLYEEAKAASEAIYAQMEVNRKQYKGDTAIDGSDTPAKHVRNMTYELLESQVTGYVPTPKVSPEAWSDRNERNAKSIETLLRAKRNKLPFEVYNDLDERLSPIYGGSVWLTEWDESVATHNEAGEVRVTCLAPHKFLGQPNIYSIEDMEYCFVCFETTKEEVVRKYGVSPSVAEETESDTNSDDDTATIYVCYYKDEDDRVCEYIWSGDKELSDITDYYSRKTYVCTRCGRKKRICICEASGQEPSFELVNDEYEELTHDIMLSDGSILPAMSPKIENGQVVMTTEKQMAVDQMGNPIIETVGGVPVPKMIDVPVPVLEPTRIPYYRPKRLPITIRKNISQEDSLFGQSDCEKIRYQQQAVNKVETRIIEKLMRAAVYPIVPEDWEGDLNNSVFGTVLRARREDYNLFGRVDMQVDISRDILEADRLYDQAKRILGITDSFQGQRDATAASGFAKQLQIQQANGRLDSKRRMKNAAYADIDRIMFEFYLAYADEPRPATYMDVLGRRQNVAFNRYDFLERDEAGNYYYNDSYLFSADGTIDIEGDRETLWKENTANYQAGTYGDPTLPQTRLIYWLNMERLHYPYAQENVERIQMEIERMMAAQQPQYANYGDYIRGGVQ